MIKKVWSGSTSVIVDDIVDNILEALFNYLCNQDEDHKSLLKFMESSDHKFEVLKVIGFTFTIEEICESYLMELRNQKQENSVVY